MLARAQGIEAWGGVDMPDSLHTALAAAANAVINEHRPALVDVTIENQSS